MYSFLHNIDDKCCIIFQHPDTTFWLGTVHWYCDVTEHVDAILVFVLRQGGGGLNFKYIKMASKLTPRDKINMEYKERIPVLPENVDDKMSDLLLAAEVTRKPMKAST